MGFIVLMTSGTVLRSNTRVQTDTEPLTAMLGGDCTRPLIHFHCFRMFNQNSGQQKILSTATVFTRLVPSGKTERESGISPPAPWTWETCCGSTSSRPTVKAKFNTHLLHAAGRHQHLRLFTTYSKNIQAPHTPATFLRLPSHRGPGCTAMSHFPVCFLFFFQRWIVVIFANPPNE